MKRYGPTVVVSEFCDEISRRRCQESRMDGVPRAYARLGFEARKSGAVGAVRIPTVKLLVTPSVAELRGTREPMLPDDTRWMEEVKLIHPKLD